MKSANSNKKLIKAVLIVALLAALLGAVTACAELGYPASSSAPQEQPATAPATSSTIISTKDAAMMAVHQRLLGQAENYKAKTYLADFYTYCDNWSVESEFFKDGSDTWYVVINMTANETQNLPPYWQQASWFVFKDGTVIPSNRFEANALRIEADLQALSPEQNSETSSEPG